MALNQKVINIADEFIEMQTKIMKLRDFNIESTINEVIKSGYIKTEGKMYEFIKEIFYISKIRPKRSKILAKFLTQLKNQEEFNFNISNLLEDIVSEVVLEAEEEDRDSFYKKTSDFRFLRFLFDESFISLDKIIEIYHSYPSNKKNQKALFALYFAPEFDQMSMLTSFLTNSNNSLHESILSIFSDLEHFKNDNWKSLKYMYENGWEEFSLGDAIKNDNFDLFQHYSMLPSFKLRKQFDINPFEQCPLVQNHNILDLACYHSILCC